MMRTLCLSLRYAVLVFAGVIVTKHAFAAQTISFGVVPQQAATKLARLWSPILARLGQCSGVNLQFRTAPNIPSFERRLERGTYDVAYMNPYHYVVFNERSGYVALGKQEQKLIRGILIVRRASTVMDLEGLKGRELAFPAPAAFAASVLIRAELSARDISFTPRYVSSHDSVYKSVAQGLFVAGGGIERTFQNIDAQTRKELRVLWRTDGYTPHAIATHPRVRVDLRRNLLECMVGLSRSDEGRRLLSSIKFSGIVSAADSDWDDVRRLNLKQAFGQRVSR